MVVGVLTIEINFPGSRSLKDKRRVLQKIIERTRSRYNISIAEVSENDLWQRSKIGIVAVSNGIDHIHSTLDKITNFINYLNVGEIISTEVELMNF